ncbi:MAG TPA: hypothetical protein PLN56_09760 [Methanoregulaceae archaeon]|jgi:outer membrane lipoprotein-sorting protein|uniref:hypothetical protein n=1 Tax=Methanoculleus sp. DTU007 TaxID=1671626 RepID=UPI0025811FC0|nr:hypothetical protein [Methanoculleus sp. DTU007]HPD11263.1 hypothetical protein [Methanoregulaceae archaeon]
MNKKLIVLLMVLVIVACCSSGCAKIAPRLAKIPSKIDAHTSTYSDSDTLPWNWMQTYELYGEKGTEFKIRYKGNAPVDLMILDAQNYKIYCRAIDSGRYTTKINGKYWLNRNEANIAFTQPDNKQYYFVIDNTDIFSNGAKSGRSVAYTITLS